MRQEGDEARLRQRIRADGLYRTWRPPMDQQPTVTSSVLFREPAGALLTEAPSYFAGLNLDQVVAAVTSGRQEYELEPYFWRRLQRADDLGYRHEVFRDLDRDEVLAGVRSFAERMRGMRRQLDELEKLHHRYEWEAWFRDAVAAYCGAVAELADDLNGAELASRGLRAFDLVARLYPDEFSALDDYCQRHRDFVEDLVATFDREIQFYVAWLEFEERIGLTFCYVERETKDPYAREKFDVALANALLNSGTPARRSRAHHRRQRAQPGRQDDLRPHGRPTASPRRAGLPRAGGRGARVPVRCVSTSRSSTSWRLWARRRSA
jgi:hypothetical protein